MSYEDLLYFDSLVHVTESGVWLNGRGGATPERLVAALEQAAPARACLVGIAGHGMPESLLQDVSGQHPDLLVPVAGVAPSELKSAKAARDRLSGLKQAGFRGVKVHPRLNRVPLEGDHLAWVMEAAAAAELPVFLCTHLVGSPSSAQAPSAGMVDALLRRHPDTPCLLLHGGTMELLDFSEVVRPFPKAYLDLSFTLLRYRGSSVDLDLRFVLEKLDQRCTVGSDFPEYQPAAARQRTLELMEGLPREKVENVLFRNLSALLGLPPG
ncbi:MAG: amidohydrolase family protein [Planctomycetota bacterium]